jgi:hypothetical protein
LDNSESDFLSAKLSPVDFQQKMHTVSICGHYKQLGWISQWKMRATTHLST